MATGISQTPAVPTIQHTSSVPDAGVKSRPKSTSDHIRDSKCFMQSLMLTDYEDNIFDSGIHEEEYAELTNQQLLHAFMDSGVTYQHANQLGITLALSAERIDTVRNRTSESGPAVFATNLVLEWLKMFPKQNNKETFLALEEKLRSVHMNSIIGKLRRRSCEGVAPALSELVGSVTSIESFTQDDAVMFGQKIGLPRRAISEVMEENQLTLSRGAYVASALYQEAERRNTILRHRFVEKVTDGLQEVCDKISTNDDVKTNFKNKVKNIKENSLKRNMHLTTAIQETEFGAYEIITKRGSGQNGATCHCGLSVDTGNRISDKRKTAVIKKSKICLGFIGAAMFLPLIIFLILIPILLNYPRYESPPDQLVIIPKTTIMYELTPSDTMWIELLECQLVGGGRCSAELLSIDCSSRIEESYDNVVVKAFSMNYLYLHEGSSVVFSSTSGTHQFYSTCSPTYIWLFTDFHSAEDSANNHFEDLACSDPPDGVLCVKLNDTSPPIPQSSYYFIRCTNDPHCSFLSNITINNYAKYDFDDSKTNSIDNTEINTGLNGEDILTIQTNPWYPRSSHICILAQLSSDQCKDDEEYYINFTPKRNPTLSYYTYIACALSVLPLVVYIVGLVVYYIRKKLYVLEIGFQ